MGKRSSARRLAMQAVFQSELTNNDISESLRHLFSEEKMTKEGQEFASHLAGSVIRNKEQIDKVLSKISKNWSLDRMSALDKSILRVAVYELMHEKDTPKAVIINEAVELAKRYGDAESARFVNGILGSAVV